MATAVQLEAKQARNETSQWRVTWRRFRKHKIGVIGLITLLTLVVLTILVPIISPFSYDYIDDAALMPDLNTGSTFKPAFWSASPGSPIHVLGTDEIGRDNLTRLFYGGRISLAVGLVTTLFVVRK